MVNSQTDDKERIVEYLSQLVDSIPADGVQFVVVASDQEMLSHVGYNTTDKAAVARRLRDIADHIHPEES
jgi:hypothetical protein